MPTVHRALFALAGCAAASFGCQTVPAQNADSSVNTTHDVTVPHDHGALDAADAKPPHDHGAPSPEDAGDARDAAEEATDAGASDDVPRDRSRDLAVRWSGVEGSVGRLAGARLVAAGGRLLAEVTLDTLTSGSDGFTLEGAVRAPGARIEAWIDENNNRRLDGPGVDRVFHARVPEGPSPAVTLSAADATLDAGVEAVTEGSDLRVQFAGFDPHAGFPFVLTVTVADTDWQVGLLRVSSLPTSGEVNFTFHGVIDGATRYTAFWFLDLNRNGVFDRFGDHFATHTGASNAQGFVIHHDHRMNRTWQD